MMTSTGSGSRYWEVRYTQSSRPNSRRNWLRNWQAGAQLYFHPMTATWTTKPRHIRRWVIEHLALIRACAWPRIASISLQGSPTGEVRLKLSPQPTGCNPQMVRGWAAEMFQRASPCRTRHMHHLLITARSCHRWDAGRSHCTSCDWNSN